MSSKKWVLVFLATVLVLAALLAALNLAADPFGAFGDRLLSWFSYDETNNPRVAKFTYLEQHHDEYDSYILGCSSTSSFPVDAFNEASGASFYNLIMYGADMRDCEKIAQYLVEHYEVKNLILNVYLDNGLTYDEESDRLTKNLHYKEDPDTSALSYYTRYLFADPRYALAKLNALRTDTILPQTFDVFDELQAYVLRGEPLPEKPVVITFDDGYRSNYTLAYPILQKYSMKATIFAIGVSFGTDHYKDTDYAITPHFGAAEAAEMTASGLISIQSHTYDMHQWPPYETGSAVRENILQLPGESEDSYVQALTEDFTRSRALLEGATGQPVDVLAYPAGQYSTLAQVTLQSLGVHVTLSTNPGVNTVVKGLPQTLYAMLRFGITEDISPEALLDMIR